MYIYTSWRALRKTMRRIIYISTFFVILTSCNWNIERKEKLISTDTTKTIDKEEFTELGQKEEKIENSLTDKQYRKLTEEIEIFEGFEDFGGTMIYDKDKKKRSLGHIKKDSLHIITLEKINEGKRPKRQILDTLHYISNSENYYTDLIECEEVKNSDRKLIFGFHFYEEGKEYFEKIGFAWQVDLKTDELKIIETDGIKCYNIGYGL